MFCWTRLPLDSPTCGSTGAGITLAPDFKGGPHGEKWLSANLASAPSTSAGQFPRGLKLWTSNDSLVNHYTEYLPLGTRTVDPATRRNNACVICPGPVRKGRNLLLFCCSWLVPLLC